MLITQTEALPFLLALGSKNSPQSILFTNTDRTLKSDLHAACVKRLTYKV